MICDRSLAVSLTAEGEGRVEDVRIFIGCDQNGLD